MKLKEITQYTNMLSALYVEDNKDLREQTVGFLNKVFNHVSYAVDGAEGIEMYQQREYDIVITDIEMPNKNGLEMIEEIRKVNPDQQIIVTSGYDDVKYLMPLINMGIDRFHIKPFDRKDFLLSIYKITMAVLFEKKEKLKSKELGQIMDVVESGIVVIEDNKVTHVNKAAYKMTYTSTKDEIQTKCDSLENDLIEIENYVFGKDIIEIIEKTKDTSFNKIMLRLASGISTFLFDCHTLDENKYVISFRDITAIENKEKYNQFTSLPNEIFLAESLEEFLKTDDEKVLFLIQVKNYEGIKKWHGIDASLEAEKKFADALKYDFYSLNLDQDGFLANIGQNRFVIVNKASHVDTIKDKLNNLRDQFLVKHESTNEHMKEISLEPKYKGIKFSEATVSGVLRIINEEFDLIKS